MHARLKAGVVGAVKDYIRPSMAVLAVIFGMVLAFACVYGGVLQETGFSSVEPDVLIVPFVVLSLLFVVLYLAIPLAVNVARDGLRTLRHVGAGSAERVSAFLFPDFNKRSILLHALVMFACWFPYIVAFFPATMGWDTAYQIDQCYSGSTVWVIPWAETRSVSDAHFSDHHPLFDTLLYGVFAVPSEKLFGTWNYGMFVFAVLQSAFTAWTFTIGVAYMGKNGAPRSLMTAVLLFFCLMPFYPAYAASMVKDSTSAPFFVLYFLMLLECAHTQGGFLIKKKCNVVGFVLVGLLLALTKKPGMYIVLLSSIILLLMYRKAWKAYLVQLSTVAVVMLLLFPLVVFPALDVIPGQKQEALGTLFHQTARFAVLWPDEVTDEEREAIDKVIVYDGIDGRYDPFCSDTVKFWYRYDTCTSDDIGRYLQVWLNQGLRHPWTYIESVLVTAAPYIALDGKLEIHEETTDVNDQMQRVWQPNALAPLRNVVCDMYHWLLDLPGLSVLFRVGLYAYVIPSLAFVALAMRRSRYLPVFIPLALSLAVCIVTPTFNARYALPLLYIAPLLVSLCFTHSVRSASS